MQENAISHSEEVLEVQRALQEGQLVAVPSRVRLGEGKPDVAVVHIFRFEAKRIAELWDIAHLPWLLLLDEMSRKDLFIR